jgi:thymidine kinase
MPTLLLNFRGEIFNETARLLMETSTDIYRFRLLRAPECLENAYNTYRYYVVDGVECPALFFDPLIIVGGDRDRDDPSSRITAPAATPITTFRGRSIPILP